ncbi:hypothetical protein V8F33_006337 [Rhypophila sp. PSN 637]
MYIIPPLRRPLLSERLAQRVQSISSHMLLLLLVATLAAYTNPKNKNCSYKCCITINEKDARSHRGFSRGIFVCLSTGPFTNGPIFVIFASHSLPGGSWTRHRSCWPQGSSSWNQLCRQTLTIKNLQNCHSWPFWGSGDSIDPHNNDPTWPPRVMALS